jgi:hypothetical protein
LACEWREFIKNQPIFFVSIAFVTCV